MKTKEEILNQIYLTANDLQILIPEISYRKCIEIISEVQQEMREKNYFIPSERPKLALVKLVKKRFGI